MRVTQKQMTRIEEMEARLENAKASMDQLLVAINEYEKQIENINCLLEYSQSEEWMKDYQADEEGLLPDHLKRGVLSEDGISDLLDLKSELVERLNELLENE